MIRSGLAICLIGAGAALSGCASGYYASPAVQPSAQLAAPRTTRAVAAADAVEITGSLAPAESVRPWPKRGTAEWNALQKEERDREERIRAVLHSICRGC